MSSFHFSIAASESEGASVGERNPDHDTSDSPSARNLAEGHLSHQEHYYTISIEPPTPRTASGPSALKSAASWAKVVSMCAGPPQHTSTIPTTSTTVSNDKDREIIIKMADTSLIEHLRSQSPSQLKEGINRAINNC